MVDFRAISTERSMSRIAFLLYLIAMDPASDQNGQVEESSTTHELVEQVYLRLRTLGERAMLGERADHTLGATGLVHEAFLRLATNRKIPWGGEAHFFVAAAQAMRRILVDHARAHNAAKRGFGRVTKLADISAVAESAAPSDILAIDDAVSRLAEEDALAAAVVHLRFFAGLSIEQTARVLDTSPRTVSREWAFARARLYELLSDSARDRK